MSFKRKLLLAILMWALLGATHALANPHDHGVHQHHQSSIVSPFEGKKEVQSAHCLLRGHAHQGFCPHSKPERSQTTSIAADCGGKTSGAIPNSTSFGSEFARVNESFLIQNSSDEKLTPIVFLSYHSFIDSLDPPPRVL